LGGFPQGTTVVGGLIAGFGFLVAVVVVSVVVLVFFLNVKNYVFDELFLIHDGAEGLALTEVLLG
jgi:hypothetical protein